MTTWMPCLEDRDHRSHWSVPEDPDVLPRRLRWSCGDGDEGREPASRAELERRYDEESARLRGADLLRSALLRVDGRRPAYCARSAA